MLWTAGLQVKIHGAAVAQTGLCEWKRHILVLNNIGRQRGEGGPQPGRSLAWLCIHT